MASRTNKREYGEWNRCRAQGHSMGGRRSTDTNAVYGYIKLTAGAVVIINELAKTGTGVGITFKRQSGKKCIINLEIV